MDFLGLRGGAEGGFGVGGEDGGVRVGEEGKFDFELANAVSGFQGGGLRIEVGVLEEEVGQVELPVALWAVWG